MYDWEHETGAQNYFDALDIVEINGPPARREQLDADEHALSTRPQATTRARAACTRRTAAAPGLDVPLEHAAGRSFTCRRGRVSFEMKVRSIAPQPQTVTVSGR